MKRAIARECWEIVHGTEHSQEFWERDLCQRTLGVPKPGFFTVFARRRSFALICALMRSFAPFCALSMSTCVGDEIFAD